MSSDPARRRRLHVVVGGLVQGVGYRYLARKHAQRLGVVGWVRNLADGRVEAEIQGADASVAELLRRLEAGPPGSAVTELTVEEAELRPDEAEFRIVR